MSDVSEADEPRTRQRLWLWVVVLPVLDVLSTGPGMWKLKPLADTVTPETRRAIYSFYSPILWAAEQSDWFQQLLTWYVGLI